MSQSSPSHSHRLPTRPPNSRILSATVGHSNAVSFPLIALDSLTSAPMFAPIPNAFSRASAVVFICAIGWNIVFYTFTYPFIGNSKREEPDQVDPTSLEAQQRAAAAAREAAGPQRGCKARMMRAWDTFWTIFLNPNMLAATIALVIAFWPALKSQLFTPGAVLRPLMQSIEFLGAGAIPLGSLVMAGNVSESLRRNFGIGGPKDADVVAADQNASSAAADEVITEATARGPGMGMGDDVAGEAVEMQSLPSGPFSRLIDEPVTSPSASEPASSTLAAVRARGSAHPYGHVTEQHPSMEAHTAPTASGAALASAAPERAVAGGAAPWAGAAVVGLDDLGDDSDEESAVGEHNNHMMTSDVATVSGLHNPNGGLGGTLVDAQNDGGGVDTLSALRSLPPLSLDSGLTYQRELRLERTVSLKAGAGVPAPPLRVTVATVAMSPRSAAIRAALPDPRLTPGQLAAAIIAKLILMPTVAFLMVGAVSKAGWTWLLPDDPVIRVVLMLTVMAPSAESMLVVVTKAGMRRQALAVSLVYLVQLMTVIVTAAIGITIALVAFF